MVNTRNKIIALFDLDGTLAYPGSVISEEMRSILLNKLKTVMHVGIISEARIEKVTEQLGGENVVKEFDFVFASNGTFAIQGDTLLAKQEISTHMGEDFLRNFINQCTLYLRNLDIPKKRGTFIQYCSGLINISPIGQNCSPAERDHFEKLDSLNCLRTQIMNYLKLRFPDTDLQYCISDQVSIDAFPVGWDKTYCLKFLSDFDAVYFFGNSCSPGGNDFEMYINPNVISYSVFSPRETLIQVLRLYNEHITVQIQN